MKTALEPTLLNFRATSAQASLDLKKSAPENNSMERLFDIKVNAFLLILAKLC